MASFATCPSSAGRGPGGLSAFCSGTEVALFALRRIDREQLARSKRAADDRIARLLERPRRLIATVLIGNEAFNSLASLPSRSLMVAGRCPRPPTWPAPPSRSAIALPLVVLFAEVTAQDARARSRRWAGRGLRALPLSAFAMVVDAGPLARAPRLRDAACARSGAAGGTRPARDLSEEEFRTLVDAGSAQGQVDARERRLIHRVFEFNDKNVGQVMTPRDQIVRARRTTCRCRGSSRRSRRAASRACRSTSGRSTTSAASLNAKDLVRAAAGQVPARTARRAAPRAAVRAAHDAGQAAVPHLQAEEGPHGDRGQRVRQGARPRHDGRSARADVRRDPRRARRPSSGPRCGAAAAAAPRCRARCRR